MKLTKIIICIVILMSFIGCSNNDKNVNIFKDIESQISFTYPKDWSEISEIEWDELDYDKNNSIITIGNINRDALFSVIPFELDEETKRTVNRLSPDIEERKEVFAHSVDLAGDEKYEEYESISTGKLKFADMNWGQVSFYGRNPGKNRRYFQILFNISKSNPDQLLMLIFSTPVGDENNFKSNFNTIEKNFKWTL